MATKTGKLSVEKIELDLKHFSIPANANAVIRHCKEEASEILAHSEEYGGITQFVPADGRIAWQLLNSVVSQTQSSQHSVFCEWGSGTGIVTLLASMIGMSATGIEIDEDLIDLARGISRQFAIPATFIHASIYPKDNPMELFDYKDVNVFFAYPWPNEITPMTNLFKQVAAPEAILLMYHGENNYRVLQR